MVVTIYETQTPDGWDGTGALTTLDRSTIIQVLQSTITASEVDTVSILSTASSETSIVGTTILSSVTSPVLASTESSVSTSSSGSTSGQSSPTSNPSGTARISTGSVVGIAVGSIAALVLLVTFLLFAFGFRVRRAKRLSHTWITKPKEDQGEAAGASGAQNGKAELEDAGYSRRLERLHDGAKPELDGSKPRKTGWRAFSIRSLKRGPRPGAAELDTGAVTQGPHELPA